MGSLPRAACANCIQETVGDLETRLSPARPTACPVLKGQLRPEVDLEGRSSRGSAHVTHQLVGAQGERSRTPVLCGACQPRAGACCL